MFWSFFMESKHKTRDCCCATRSCFFLPGKSTVTSIYEVCKVKNVDWQALSLKSCEMFGREAMRYRNEIKMIIRSCQHLKLNKRSCRLCNDSVGSSANYARIISSRYQKCFDEGNFDLLPPSVYPLEHQFFSFLSKKGIMFTHDQTFPSSKSLNRPNLRSSETLIDGFWGAKISKCLVRSARVDVTKRAIHVIGCN